jgi:hypothetical protein
MSIFELGLLKQNEKTKDREFYNRHFLNAVNGILSSGRTDFDKIVQDADMIARKSIEFLKEDSKKEAFKFKELLKI